MNGTQSPSGGIGREFYAPATFRFSATPGLVERTLTHLFRQRGAMDGHPRGTVPMREFYAPATLRFSARPGRIERLVGEAFRQRGAMDGRPEAEPGEVEHPFYAPATVRGAFQRRGRRPNAR